MQHAQERFWARVHKTETCWLWTGRTSHGYGVFWDGGGGHAAHRVSFAWAHGPIPSGTEIDHLCRNKLCVRPDHLEAVTHTVNVRRGTSPSALHRVKTHCYKGHAFSPDNTRINERGWRTCITCKREGDQRRSQAFRDRQKAGT